MSWMQKLYETYDVCSGNRSIPDSDTLCPVGYSVQNAHIEVVLDADGKFRRANYVSKSDAKTLIPVTEKSAGRTSGEAPHLLCDSLQYCACDYEKFGGTRESYFESYYDQLKEWAQSSHTHPKVVAIFSYIEKKCLVQDLVSCELVDLNDGILNVGRKESENTGQEHPLMKLLTYDDKGIKDQAKVFVRWSVEDNDLCSHTWQDKTLFDAWGKYSASKESVLGFCYVTGKNTALAVKHPAKLRNGKDGAKLISSNDTSGYTYLGRLTEADQVAGVSSEVTQKAHSALRWLISRKQAFRSGDQVFVSWAVQGTKIPDPWANSLDFLEEDESTKIPATITDVGQTFSNRFRRKMAGYAASIKDDEDIVVMGLDSATPGRMAITFYRELKGSEFLERIESWHHEVTWIQNYGKDHHFVGAPAPKEIAWAAFGKKVEGKNGTKLLNSTVERLLPCILDGSPLPKDLVVSSARRAANRIGHKKEKIGRKEYEVEWEKCLGIACALFKGINSERNYQMTVEDQRNTRDYLYGQLLAVAEKIESMALFFAKEHRDTTAARLMQRFGDRPFSTWRTIETALVPYKARLHAKCPGLLNGYDELLDQIHAKFVENDYSDDSRLSGEYLLGYHCQRSWFSTYKRKDGKWIPKEETELEFENVEIKD